MTAAEIIEKIKKLPKEERNKVLEFARNLSENRFLTPEELEELTQRMVEAKDPAEVERLKEEITRGFYGN